MPFFSFKASEMSNYSGSINFISTLQLLVSADWISGVEEKSRKEGLGELNKYDITVRQVKELRHKETKSFASQRSE